MKKVFLATRDDAYYKKLGLTNYTLCRAIYVIILIYFLPLSLHISLVFMSFWHLHIKGRHHVVLHSNFQNHIIFGKLIILGSLRVPVSVIPSRKNQVFSGYRENL